MMSRSGTKFRGKSNTVVQQDIMNEKFVPERRTCKEQYMLERSHLIPSKVLRRKGDKSFEEKYCLKNYRIKGLIKVILTYCMHHSYACGNGIVN